MRDAQLALQFSPAGVGTFDNFVRIGNEEVFTLVQQACEARTPHLVVVWGAPGSGKSHLLDAVCQRAQGAPYIPLGSSELEPAVLEGMEALAQVVLDDLDSICGENAWGEAIFHLANRCAQRGSQLWVATKTPPAQLTGVLPDLRSRLSQGLILHLTPPSDGRLPEFLEEWARMKGLVMSREVIQYIVTRAPRAPARLFPLLERLAEATLVRQKRPSVPIVKELLDA